MGNKKALIFRGLIIIAIAGLVAGWFLDWWSTYVVHLQLADAVVIHPWGLEYGDLGTFKGYLEGADMPAIFAPLMWIYFGLCVVVLLASLFLRGKTIKIWKYSFSLPGFILFAVGVSYIVVAITVTIVAAIRTGDFYGLKLLGTTYVYVQDHVESDMISGFEIGYWLVWGTGVYCLILALLRKKLYI